MSKSTKMPVAVKGLSKAPGSARFTSPKQAMTTKSIKMRLMKAAKKSK